jgi:hypothetical protein
MNLPRFPLLPGNVFQNAKTDKQYRCKRQQDGPGVERNASEER